MAKLSHTDSRRMYSWWWDSHISPKNSKWLQENLTDMDVKVKSMIKLIEEDADSFARRAEMYYKKRPELMKLVEEFYRAYRALAERYDHATGVIRHAHRTMSEAFPNQVPLMFSDESGTEPRTPDLSTPNGEITDESDSVTRRKNLKPIHDQFGASDRVRKGLNFDEIDENDESNGNSHVKDTKLQQMERASDSEEILVLKEALAKLEAEKEKGLAEYQQSLDKISQLESEAAKTREELKLLTDQAAKAENEAVLLKESLAKVEIEKESKLQDYQHCLEKISDLHKSLSAAQEDAKKLDKRANNAENEAQSLQGKLDEIAVEKDTALNQYMESLEMISNLENKLRLAEEDASKLKERAENAENEAEILKQTISKMNEEKEAAASQYQQLLEKISNLETKLALAEEEAKRLNLEIDNGVSKLKGAEEQCLLLERSNQSLHSELESLMMKMGTQTQELTEKQKELGRLWACIQEERLRFVEAETAFQTLQHLHAQTQEELRSMASELQNRAQVMKALENNNQSLQDEVLKVKEEDKNLDELNASSALSIKEMQSEISSLKESKGKLEEEVELRIDQRNALQQEIYCLKEELNDLNKKHVSVMDQVHLVGLNPEALGSSVKELQDENSNLKETCQKESIEKAALLGKLAVLDQLLEKNSMLETSLSDLQAELEAVRGKIEALEQTCESLLKEKSTLLDEKATLISQLEETNKNLQSLSEDNNVLANSLADANQQLEALTAKSRILEDSCQLLVNDKAGLISERNALTSKLEDTQVRLKDLGNIYEELEKRCITLEKEKEMALCRVNELQVSLDLEKQEHSGYIQMSEEKFKYLEAQMGVLQGECESQRKELDQMLESAFENDIEGFVLHVTAQQLQENNCFFVAKNQKLLEESGLSEQKISRLEQDKFEQEVEIRSLADQAFNLRAGISQLMKILNIVEDHSCKDQHEQDQIYVNLLLMKLQKMKESLSKAEDENQQWNVEFSIFVTCLREMGLDSQILLVERNNIEHEFKAKTEQLILVQNEVRKLLDINNELSSKLSEEKCNKEALMTEVEDLNKKLMDMQSEKFEISEQKRSLMDDVQHLEGKNSTLEEENHVLCDRVLALENLSFIFRSCADEKLVALKKLSDDLSKLNDMNTALIGKLSLADRNLEESKAENLHLQEKLQKSADELEVVSGLKDELSNEIEKEKEVLRLVELELLDAKQKINLIENEKVELNRSVEDLRVESNNDKIIRDHQENQILNLSTDNDRLTMENNRLHEVSRALENELEEKINENKKMETDAASVFSQLQQSMVSQLLFEQKFLELNENCVEYMDQNESLKTQLAAYGPEILALKDCISSLENQTDIHIKFENPESEDSQGAQVAKGTSEPCEDKTALMPDSLSGLRNLRIRLQAIEKAAVEIKDLMVQENTGLRSKLDSCMNQLQSLQSEGGQYRRNSKPSTEITEADASLLTKDIVLDQISDGSSYGVSKREPFDKDDGIVELWETADPDGTIGLTVGKSKKPVSSEEFLRIKSIKKQKGDFPTSDELLLKEFSVDKLEISSKRSTEPLQEGNKRKVLERLDSDVQKLANLQITVQDMKRKLEVIGQGKRGKAVIECEALKGQLEEADVAVMKLFELNGRLTKNIEDNNYFSSSSSFDLDADGNARRRRVSEQARRMSEKIGRLQLEVQKLQFVLLKLDEGNRKMSETKRRVLLRDYLYGGGRTGQRRKKAQFCACVQPSTKE